MVLEPGRLNAKPSIFVIQVDRKVSNITKMLSYCAQSSLIATSPERFDSSSQQNL